MTHFSSGTMRSTCSTGIRSSLLPKRPARTSSISGSEDTPKRTPRTVPIVPAGDSTWKPSQRRSQ